MKTRWFTWLICSLLLLAARPPGWAQKHGTPPLSETYAAAAADLPARRFTEFNPETPKLAGYWTVETSFTLHDYSLVRFYDGHNTLVYEEGVAHLFPASGRSARRRTDGQLDAVLQRVLREPAARGSGNLLARQLPNKEQVQGTTPARPLAGAAAAEAPSAP